MTSSTTLSTSALADAFATFNQLSAQLADSYQALEIRVSELNEELARTHHARLQELSEKERLAKRLSTLLQILPGGVVVLDGSGCVQEHNQAAMDLLGSPLAGVNWVDVIQRAFAPRHDDGHEVSLVDGRRVTIATCPMVNEPGQILLLTDVTEMRNLQDQLNHQQRLAAMGEMAAALAHQIRTPLASAMLYTSQLKHPGLAGEERERFGEKIRSRLAHLERIVNDMLLYARSGKTTHAESFNCRDLMQDLEHSLDAWVLNTHTTLDVRDETQGIRLSGNRQMLVSALTNLAVNAIQAMGNDGKLSVVARPAGDGHVELLVIDNGPGITPDKLTQIFNPFYTTRKDGTGLGLAVVNAIIRSHHGNICVDSKVNHGTTFVMQLPRLQNTAASEMAVAESDSIARLSRAG